MQKATGGFLAVICEGQPVVAFQATSRSEALILPGPYVWGQRNNLCCNLARHMLKHALPEHSLISERHVMLFVENVLAAQPAKGFILEQSYIREWYEACNSVPGD